MMNFKFKDPMTNQYQLEYAVYMMLSSYFGKARCLSKITEKKLYLYYQELNERKQYELEDEIIEFIENTLLRTIDIPDIDKMDVDVRFVPNEEGNILVFEGRTTVLNLSIRKKGGKIKFTFSKKSFEPLPEKGAAAKRVKVKKAA